MKRRTVCIIAGAVVLVAIATGVGLWQYHQQPQFCSICHIMQPYLASWEGTELLANAHAQADVTCLECHEPTIQQQVDELVAYVTGDYREPLRERAFSKDWCFRCHEHQSYAQVIELTQGLKEEWGRNPHDSHFGELECRHCHKMHRESTIYCAQCHAVPTPSSGVWK